MIVCKCRMPGVSHLWATVSCTILRKSGLFISMYINFLASRITRSARPSALYLLTPRDNKLELRIRTPFRKLTNSHIARRCRQWRDWRSNRSILTSCTRISTITGASIPCALTRVSASTSMLYVGHEAIAKPCGLQLSLLVTVISSRGRVDERNWELVIQVVEERNWKLVIQVVEVRNWELVIQVVPRMWRKLCLEVIQVVPRMWPMWYVVVEE